MAQDSVEFAPKIKMPVTVLALAVLAMCVATAVFGSPLASIIIGVLACAVLALVAPEAKKRGAFIAMGGLTLVMAVAFFVAV